MSDKKWFIGIDPGKNGAMAVIHGDEVSFIPFDEDAYVDMMLRIDETNAVCCLERVASRPGQGVKSVFTFGENYGWIQGALRAMQIPYQTVPPQKWKKEFCVTADKQTSINVCKKLYPSVRLRRSERCRVDDDGLAEALLIATYAKRKF